MHLEIQLKALFSLFDSSFRIYSVTHNQWQHNLKRESHISLRWLSCGTSVLVELKFGVVGFCGGRKTRDFGGKFSEQVENQQQTHRSESSPRLFWREASAITTSPSLLPSAIICVDEPRVSTIKRDIDWFFLYLFSDGFDLLSMRIIVMGSVSNNN